MVTILERKCLYRDGEYVSFPNLAFLSDGRMMCAFRHARERQQEYGRVTHVDPTAKDVFILSEDGGETFSKELHVIADDEMSEQDPCVNVLSDGRIIVTYFRWDLCTKGEGGLRWGEDQFKAYGRVLFDRYDCLPNGACYAISDDNGQSWKRYGPIRIPGVPEFAAVRGNLVEMPDGCLLLPCYSALNLGELSRSVLLLSKDRGETWERLSDMAFDSSCVKNYLEPGIYCTPRGKLVGLYRTQTDFLKPGVDFEQTYLNLHISESYDGGKTFGPVREIQNLWGSSPFHALRLPDCRVLLSYGWRKEPYGIRVRICDPELEHIEEGEEIVLCDDAPNGDLGYPHAILLKDGTVMVAYYISGQDGIRKIEAVRMKIE